jgi:hypothetical protein
VAGVKQISRCPVCTRTDIASRKTKSPKFRCDRCHAEFDVPAITDANVTHFRTDHEQGWVDLAGLLDGPTLRGLTEYSQNSIRRIDWNGFASAIEANGGPSALAPVTLAHFQVIGGGHSTRQVKVRIGQPAFRAELIGKYGSVCAFTGSAPREALEACHLYSYAEIGRHDVEGGLLLRRDLHRLFDQGLLAVSPRGTIDVAERLMQFKLYAALQGQSLSVRVSAGQREWLALHWAEWRSRVITHVTSNPPS